MSTVLLILLAACLISGAVLAVAFLRAPYVSDEQAAAWGWTQPLATFDQHVAVACALLQSGDPRLPADTPLADAAEAWLRDNTNQES